MQIINCKMSYIFGDNIIFTTELKNNDYKIDIETSGDILSANMQTNKDFRDFKIEFYLKIDKKYTTLITNGYQTWIPAHKLSENKKPSKIGNFIIKNIYKGTGLEYISDFNDDKTVSSSYGFCYLKENNSDNILLFASLDEKDTFTKFNYDFERNVLKIIRDFKGSSINKNFNLIKLIKIEENYDNAVNKLKELYKINDDNKAQKRLIADSTFSEYGNKINEEIINSKIHRLQKDYQMFIVGDGYSVNGYDLFSIDCKRFPKGLKSIVDNIHTKGIKACLWIAPFAISPLSKSFSKYQDLVVKQNEKPVTTCPFWNNSYSLDITKNESIEYLKNLFDLIINDWGFDAIYCDCMYMAGSVPIQGKTSAMLINDAINLIRELTKGTTLILGGVPFLSAVNNCDYISISPDTKNNWNSPFDKLLPEFPLSIKSNVKGLIHKKILDDLYFSICTIPNNKKIKSKLLSLIAANCRNLIIPENVLKQTTYPAKFKLNEE